MATKRSNVAQSWKDIALAFTKLGATSYEISERLHRHVSLQGPAISERTRGLLACSRRRKVLFGSNYPAWPAKDCLEGFESLGLDDAATALLLYENAAGVFKLGNA